MSAAAFTSGRAPFNPVKSPWWLPCREQGNLTSSWGGSVLLDAATGTWHMYSAEMVNDCGIGYWTPNSRIVHATSSHVEGPYTRVGVVEAPFAHEPNAVRTPGQGWASIYIYIYIYIVKPTSSFRMRCSNIWIRDVVVLFLIGSLQLWCWGSH